MSTISFQQRTLGALETGQPVTCYSLRNTSGMAVHLLNYGAAIHSIQVPDSRGKMHAMTVGDIQPSELEYTATSKTMFVHLPARYSTSLNQLHTTLWEAQSTSLDEAASVILSLNGTLDLRYPFSKAEYQISCEYILTASNEFIIKSRLTFNQLIPAFLTHQPIWNLSDKEDLTPVNYNSMKDHILQIWASNYSQLDTEGFIRPEVLFVRDRLDLDFQQPQRIGEKQTQASNSEQTQNVCFRLSELTEHPTSSSTYRLAARVKEPISGRTLEITTTQSGLKFDSKTQGFCLSPMPLITQSIPEPQPNSDVTFQQATRYKLIW